MDERYGDHTPDIIDNSYTVVDFTNRTRAMLNPSMFADGSENQELFTLTATVRGSTWRSRRGRSPSARAWVQHGPKRRNARRSASTRRFSPPDIHYGATYYQHLAFLRAVRGEGPVEVTAQDGHRAVVIGAAAELSACEHRAVDIAEFA